MKKIYSFSLLSVISCLTLFLIMGYNNDDPKKAKQNTDQSKIAHFVTPPSVPFGADVVIKYIDSCNGDNSVAALNARNYKTYYRGTGPQGESPIWFNDVNGVGFSAYNGPDLGMIESDFNSVTGDNTIDNWLVFPALNIAAGDSLIFYAGAYNSAMYPDSIYVCYNAAGDTLPESTNWVLLGKFFVPSYQPSLVPPWERFAFGAPTAGTNGRFAIRYHVANGGPSGSNSSTIAIDYFTIAGTNVTPLVWSEQTSGLTTALQSVSVVNDNVAWTCGSSGKVLRTTNSGVTWVNVSGTIPTSLILYCIFGWDENLALVTGVSGSNTSIYKTSDGGTTWTLTSSHAGFGDDLYMTSATDAYFIGDPVGGNWDLLKSTNGGDNWETWATVSTSNTTGTYNNAGCFNGQQVWFSPVGDANFQYTSNMGVNWSVQSLSLANITATWFSSATVGMAGGSSTSAGLLMTTNSGANWTTVTQTFIGSRSIAGITSTGSSWWVAKQDTTIYYSSDNGVNWEKQYRGPGTGVYYHMSKARTGENIWAVRSNGAISRYGQPLVGITPISNEIPSSFSLSQNYPNPFNPVTKINFTLPKSGLVTMKVYDVLGKEITTLVNEVKNAGIYKVDFNGAKLSSGIYFYKLESNGFSQVKKMMLIK
jgi:hypothetical protein